MPHWQLELVSCVLRHQVLSVQLILSTYFLVSSKCVFVCVCVCRNTHRHTYIQLYIPGI